MRAVLLLLLALLAAPRAGWAADDGACGSAIAAAERRLAMPPLVMKAIATVESGRPVGHRVVPWPWSVNAAGVSHFYRSKEEAVQAVTAMRAEGMQSIDVGCMQINLLAHPAAFASIDDAFDPAANADYAARFLRELLHETGQLASAMTSYHSRTPAFAADYARRLLAVWPGAAALGLRGDKAPARKSAEEPPKTHSLLLVASIHGAAWPGR